MADQIAVLEPIYAALEEDPCQALDLAREALNTGGDGSAELHFLAGVALVELDRLVEAESELSRACQLSPEDSEFHAWRSLAQFRACRFKNAEEEVRKAFKAEEITADAHAMVALLQERNGEHAEADAALARAAAEDPDRFHLPERLSRDAFQLVVDEAADCLPDQFKECLQQVMVTVFPLPTDEILFREDPPMDPEILGSTSPSRRRAFPVSAIHFHRDAATGCVSRSGSGTRSAR